MILHRNLALLCRLRSEARARSFLGLDQETHNSQAKFPFQISLTELIDVQENGKHMGESYSRIDRCVTEIFRAQFHLIGHNYWSISGLCCLRLNRILPCEGHLR